MLLSASILLLGCSSAFADAHGNSMGCCEVKRVPGSMPKSGFYYLDTEYTGSLPDVCKNSCVYNAESGPARYCFSASSTYTAECQDSGDVTTASLEDLTAKVKTIQKKMESVGNDIEEAETTKAAAEDISNKIDSLDMDTFITGSRFRRQAASTIYPTPTDCDGLKSSMTDLASALDSTAPDYDTARAASIVTMLTNLDASTLSPRCSSTDLVELINARNTAKDEADALGRSSDNLIREKKTELNSLLRELSALIEDAPTPPPSDQCGSDGGPGTLGYMQCNGEPDGTSCTKICTADDCRPPQAKCCNGCCRRGKTLADYGCETK